ncbi:MAG: hypothetical protein II909_02175 [Kiritimatiellae bacterium]|nr:hypothetical protein [Kiritimatiellia bacterium]
MATLATFNTVPVFPPQEFLKNRLKKKKMLYYRAVVHIPALYLEQAFSFVAVI